MAPEQSDDQASRIKAAAVDVRPENPDSDVARWCLEQYYRELAERFVSGRDQAHVGVALGSGLRGRPPPAARP